MSNYKVFSNVDGLRDMTDAEKVQYDKDIAKDPSSEEVKLNTIKEIRLQKLIETDYLANSDVTMPDNVKTWRQTLRDLPANHTDEAAYDALLARDSDGNLTNSVWSKP
jgi:hypothetical protein